ncbi:HAD family hydrolase [Candidatus Riflebacteria bacterium]
MKFSTCPDSYAFLFDVDGVIAETPHEEAWKEAAIDWELVAKSYDFTGFYAAHVAGEPGLTGAGNILELLCEKDCSSYYEKKSIIETRARRDLAVSFRNLKQEYLNRFIAAGQFQVFADIVRMILELKAAGFPIAAVSASENAKKILDRIDAVSLARQLNLARALTGLEKSLYDIFDTTALGSISHWHGAAIKKTAHYAMAYGKLLGKINPATIPYVVVFEDAPRGVAAVTSLGFCCVGISRISTSGTCLASVDELKRNGAELAFTETELENLSPETLLSALRGIVGSSA